MGSKIFALIFLGLSLNISASEYGGSSKYPYTSASQDPQYIVSVKGVPMRYSMIHTALSAAYSESQKCSCEVTVTPPVIKVNTLWKPVPASSSSSSSAASSVPVVTQQFIEWKAPAFREDGSRLGSVLGYHIKQSDGESTYIHFVSPSATEFIVDPSKGVDLEIAAEDSNNLLSDFIKIPVKRRSS